MLDSLVLNGSVTVLALVFLAVELIVVLFVLKRTRLTRGLILNVLSGAFLILALRSALLDQGSVPVAIFLGLGGLAHIAELVTRLKQG